MGSIDPPDKQPIQSRWIWTKLNCKMHAYSVNFDWTGLRKVSFPFFHLVEYDFPMMPLCLYFWQGIWLICPAYCFLVTYFVMVFTEIDLIPLMAQAKNIEFELTHNSTLSCIRVRTLMKLFFSLVIPKWPFQLWIRLRDGLLNQHCIFYSQLNWLLL